jgi:hypothetical protein
MDGKDKAQNMKKIFIYICLKKWAYRCIERNMSVSRSFP